MQGNFSNSLKKAISHERLDAYIQRGTDGSDLNLFAHYAWNIALCESLYPALQALEVSLRNSLHDAAVETFNSDSWFDDPRLISHPNELESIKKAKDILRIHNKPLESGRIVAELQFGFWTSLFDRRYEQVLWPKLIKKVVPSMPKRLRTRRNLSKRFNRIRHIRNRVFHHEPIWYWTDLKQQHAGLLETISWINRPMCLLIQKIDNFGNVYDEGIKPYEEILTILISDKS
ncbi:MAG TPA: hypothetical protein ENG78_04465 [Acidiferrobacteraceae bacterium]|nr:hypothetical protein [Acidiferrobacteraceae bacterium]HEX20056.1 hypothetical protein [Acidiferrobacteraceae bacterium]